MKSAQGDWRVGKYKCSIMWKFFPVKNLQDMYEASFLLIRFKLICCVGTKDTFLFYFGCPRSGLLIDQCVHQGTWLSIFKWSNLCCWCLSMISNIMSLQSLADLTQVAWTLQDKSASYLIFHHYTWYSLNVKQL